MITIGLLGYKNSDSEPEVKLDKDTVFHLLSNSRRRAVLKILAEHENLDERELREKVVEMEYGIDYDAASDDEKQRIRVSLKQCHYPKLEEHDVIETDHNRILIGDTATQLLEFIDW